MTHIFISYAKKDTRELAIALDDALNAIDGVTAWVDRSLRAGRSWELQIQSQIDRCDVMIVLYSPDINRHQQGESESYVLTEIAYAKYTARKPIIPVMAQTTTPPISLTMEHYIDFTRDGLTLDDLVDAICAELEISQPSIGPPIPTRPTSLSLLPAPFAWIEIPGGRGTMKTDESGVTLTIPTEKYWMSKYPVTNAQFAKFMDAEGYSHSKWWTPDGWKAREMEKWTQPRYWSDGKWNSDTQPVVGVSWYESVAFCLWLSETTGENIMLPTEAQWQYAAQGDDGRTYPWGNDWDCKRCNNSVEPCDSNVTTPVTQYEGKAKGDSPFGVVDMAGNVWEWCLTDYEKRTNNINSDATYRVLRGGACDFISSDLFRCGFRDWFDPRDGFGSRGFRLSRFN